MNFTFSYEIVDLINFEAEFYFRENETGNSKFYEIFQTLVPIIKNMQNALINKFKL